MLAVIMIGVGRRHCGAPVQMSTSVFRGAASVDDLLVPPVKKDRAKQLPPKKKQRPACKLIRKLKP